MSFLWFLIVGIIAGFLAGKVMRGTGFGLIGDLIVGVLGALLGGWVFGLLHISLTSSPVRGAQGEIIGASKIARDITDRKRAEEAIQMLHEQVQC